MNIGGEDGGDVSMDARRHGCLIRVGLIAVCITGSTTAARAGQIRLWPTAVVEQDSVILADVAELRGFDAATTEKLARAVLFDAPRPGGESILTSDELRQVLSEAGANLGEISFFGSSRCKVFRPPAPREVVTRTPIAFKPEPRKPARKTPVAKPAPRVQHTPQKPITETIAAEGTLERALREFITARADNTDGRLDIRFSPACADSLAMSAPPFRFEIHPRSTEKLGLLSFEVDAIQDGGEARTIPVVAEVALVRDVVVARRPINRGEPIEGRALKLEERRFTEESAIGLTELASAVGMRSKGFLRAGDMLTGREIENKPVVNRGQPVTIWMRQGGLVIRASGKAQQSGSLGDRIEVMRDGTHRKQDLVEAVVTGPGTVSVDRTTQVALGAE